MLEVRHFGLGIDIIVMGVRAFLEVFGTEDGVVIFDSLDVLVSAHVLFNLATILVGLIELFAVLSVSLLQLASYTIVEPDEAVKLVLDFFVQIEDFPLLLVQVVASFD